MKFRQAIQLLTVMLIITAQLFVGRPLQAQAQARDSATQALEAQQAVIDYHPATGKVRFIGSQPGRPLARVEGVSEGTGRVDAARGYLTAYGQLFGLEDQQKELKATRQRGISGGRTMVRFQQLHAGVPVFGAELIVQLDRANNMLATSGEIAPALRLSTTPVITAAEARKQARGQTGRWHSVRPAALRASEPELWIYVPELVGPDAGAARLVWRVEVTPLALKPIRELVLIDAERGNVALHFNQIDEALERKTYTAGNGYTLPGTLVCAESDPTCAAGDAQSKAAHKYAGHTYNFYASQHGRDSLDNAGMAIKSTVHYGYYYFNAFWNGLQMVYGDGAGFALADDVVGHEMTHGVTEHESNLFYYYQSGAINESLSDAWGEFIDLTNGSGNDTGAVRWLLGEDISGIGTIRSMKNPPKFGSPDKMTSALYQLDYWDNGGVHTNSGINNKAVYLMVDGGTFNGQTISPLGINKVAAVYYEAQTGFLTSGSDYGDLHNALYQGCLNLIGTKGITAADCQEVREATVAVEMNKQPFRNFNKDVKMCPVGLVPQHAFLDNLEQGADNWTFANMLTGTTTISPTNRWFYDSPYEWMDFAHSGEHFLYADDAPRTYNQPYQSDSVAQMNNFVTVPSAGYLHFAHAYDFESGGYDGAVLEYQVQGQAWRDAGPLFAGGGYNGAIPDAVFTNSLHGRRAFIADSHGYISSRLNLSTLAGQQVRFRFRLATDAYYYNLGWFVDDVRVYTCKQPGTVVGRVTDTNGSPLAGVEVLLEGETSRLTSATGHFTMTNMPEGSYTLSASRFGYGSEEALITISPLMTTTQDFELSMLPTVTVSGSVTDGSGQGWGLYSKIELATKGYSETIYTDPESGAYAITLPQDTDITLKVSALSRGYTSTSRGITTRAGGNDESFSLVVDSLLCAAPGYANSAVYYEPFEDSDGAYVSGGLYSSWAWGVPTAEPATAHSGKNVWATGLASNYYTYEKSYVTSPLIDLSAAAGKPLTLSWWQWLSTEKVFDSASLQASRDGGTSWSTIYGEVSGQVSNGWQQVLVPLDAGYVTSGFQLRFVLRSDYSITYPGWAIDDVMVDERSDGVTTCVPLDGGLVVGTVASSAGGALVGATVADDAGHSATTFATPLDAEQDDGLFILFAAGDADEVTASKTGYTSSTQSPAILVKGIVRQDFTLDPVQ